MEPDDMRTSADPLQSLIFRAHFLGFDSGITISPLGTFPTVYEYGYHIGMGSDRFPYWNKRVFAQFGCQFCTAYPFLKLPLFPIQL